MIKLSLETQEIFLNIKESQTRLIFEKIASIFFAHIKNEIFHALHKKMQKLFAILMENSINHEPALSRRSHIINEPRIVL